MFKNNPAKLKTEAGFINAIKSKMPFSHLFYKFIFHKKYLSRYSTLSAYIFCPCTTNIYYNLQPIRYKLRALFRSRTGIFTCE